MSAVAAPRPVQATRRAVKPAAYVRPAPASFGVPGETPAQRLATLQASMAEAAESLEQAYEAAERGEPVDVLLDLIAHSLLVDAMRPMQKETPTAADAEATRDALFTVTAALEGSMALAVGSVIFATLAHAFQILDWVIDECEAFGMEKLLPAAAPEDSFARGRDLAIDLVNQGRELGYERELFRKYRGEGQVSAQVNFVKPALQAINADPTLVDGFSALLSTVLGNDDVIDLSAFFSNVTAAETTAGVPGADGTDPVFDEAEEVVLSVAPEEGVSLLEQETAVRFTSDAYVLACEAVAVMEAATTQHAKAVVWGARSLAEHAAAAVMKACGSPFDEDAYNDASADLEQAIAVVALVYDQFDDTVLSAARTLLEATKAVIDSTLTTALRAQRTAA